MLERAGGKTWEELVVERVFGPLGLRSAGFGPQAGLGCVDAPLGHLVGADGTPKPMLAGPNGDNPAVIGPAGTVHLSILDFARWAGSARPWSGPRRCAGCTPRSSTCRRARTPRPARPAAAATRSAGAS
jgi:CubicO group peptidase (beta-lactamase class C family)